MEVPLPLSCLRSIFGEFGFLGRVVHKGEGGDAPQWGASLLYQDEHRQGLSFISCLFLATALAFEDNIFVF